ncbi:MAG: CorA family divalent cation transporter, partial [Anaerolineales bacterium]
MIRILYAPPSSLPIPTFSLEQLPEVLRKGEGLIWVDFCAEPNETCEPILREIFGFHPLAIEDALEQTNLPKVDDWGEYLYLVVDALDYSAEDGLKQVELDVFLGKHYLVTH